MNIFTIYNDIKGHILSFIPYEDKDNVIKSYVGNDIESFSKFVENKIHRFQPHNYIWEVYNRRSKRLLAQCHMDNGQFNGLAKFWYPDEEWKLSWGFLRRECYYKNGILHGISKEWYADEHIREWLYRDGQIVRHRNFYPHGALCFEQQYVNGKKHGVKKNYYKDGEQLLQVSMYKNDKMDGKLITWHPNGVKKTEAYYKDGEYHGIYTTWSKEGDMTLKVEYRNGKYHGMMQIWVKNTLILEASYGEGEYIGRRRVWYDSGKPKLDEFYDNRSILREQKEWDEHGTLIRFTNFDNK